MLCGRTVAFAKRLLLGLARLRKLVRRPNGGPKRFARWRKRAPRLRKPGLSRRLGRRRIERSPRLARSRNANLS